MPEALVIPAPPVEPLLHEDPGVHERRWFLLGVLCTSLIMVVMAVSSLNVAAPAIQQGLDATSTQLHWIIDAYAIVFAGLLLTAGALGDRYGRKGALLVGLVGFALGLLIAGLATSPEQVIAGRAVMGIGAAFVMPATLSLITAIFPPEERGRAIAMWAGFAGAGGAIGPIVSGLMLEKFWWGSTILINLPVVAAVATVIALYAPAPATPTTRRWIRPGPCCRSSASRAASTPSSRAPRRAGPTRSCSVRSSSAPSCSVPSSSGSGGPRTRCCRCGCSGTVASAPAASPSPSPSS